MKIGILGGTFDPPHNAHIALAEAAVEQLGLDEVVFMPASRNPFKKGPQTSPKMRLEMVKRAIEDHKNLAVSDLEITRGGQSYAVDTLTELAFAQPADYWFIIGADAIRNISQWKQPGRLIKLCRLGVVLRYPITESEVLARLPQEFKNAVDIITMPTMHVSSSEIRNMVPVNQMPVNLVPPAVLKYIHDKELYKTQ